MVSLCGVGALLAIGWIVPEAENGRDATVLCDNPLPSDACHDCPVNSRLGRALQDVGTP
jgi:hypothetical protein